MARGVCLTLLLLTMLSLLFMASHVRKIKEERLQMEQLLWVEFDAAMHGLIRMLQLAEAGVGSVPPQSARPALLAAYEHSIVVKRLSPVAKQLLEWRGIDSEPLAGYLLSLTGGVASACEDARQHGHTDGIWIGEIRRRLDEVHSVVNLEAIHHLSPQALQKQIEGLFSGDVAASYYAVPTWTLSAAPSCW